MFYDILIYVSIYNHMHNVTTIHGLLLSVKSPFSDRVGLPLHNIPYPFLSVMDIFSVDLKFCHVRFYTQ